jgi:hypothetical protein
MNHQNATVEEITAFNRRWEERQKELFATPQNEKIVEYSKTLNSISKKTYTRDEAKQIFFKKLLTVVLADKEKIINFIRSEKDYAELINLLIDLVFNFDNEALKNKGGIYIWSEPGVGKTSLMATACNIASVLHSVAMNPNIVKWHHMRNDISIKLKNANDVDLTYLIEGNLFLDELTEKINQVNHYGEYKYSINEIIQNRYDLWKSKGYWTVIGTNIFSDDLKQMVDTRSWTRFEEQYLIINLLGKNKRAK